VPRHARGKLTSVSGIWVVPTATCSAGHEAYSAVWVGLGGYHEHAEGLEQLGTEQDCNDKGLASYAAWFEILPASPHAIHINVHPGDTVSASTTVAGHSVTFRMRDLTTGARYATTRHTATTDVSSADWILEAPSTCATSGRCTALQLANVGTVDFASAAATAGRQTKPAGDAVWSNATLKLEQASVTLPGRPFHAEAEPRAGSTRTLLAAATSAAAAPTGRSRSRSPNRSRSCPRHRSRRCPASGEGRSRGMRRHPDPVSLARVRRRCSLWRSRGDLPGTHRRKCPKPRQSATSHGHPHDRDATGAARKALQIGSFRRKRRGRERALCKQEVTGSIPVGSIRTRDRSGARLGRLT